MISSVLRHGRNGRSFCKNHLFRPTSYISWADDDDIKSSNRLQPNNFNLHSSTTTSKRNFHATTKKEILPVIALGVGVVGMYSYRALKRMDQDWEDYEDALREYNLEHGIQEDDILDNGDIGNSSGTSSSTASNFHRSTSAAASRSAFKDGTMAIDLGTRNVRIAHKPSNLNPNIIVNRTGSRSTQNHIVFEADGNFLSGKLASAKFYERLGTNHPVVNPGELLREGAGTADKAIRSHMVQQVVSSCASEALSQVLGTKNMSSQALFSIDSGMGGYNVQPIFTYSPASSINGENAKDEDLVDGYRDALKNLSVPDAIATFIPEPVAAVHGAKFHSILPSQPGPVMVIDVGASTTSVSMVDVNSNKIIHHSTLNGFGGETLVEALMDYLSKSFYGSRHNDVQDKMGIQRIYDAAQDAVMELSSGSKKHHGRVQINIPYLSVDEKMQPKHMDLGVSAKVLEAEFNDIISAEIVPDSAQKQDVLSQSMKNPSDLSSLFSSMIMKVFEQTGQSPFALGGILVVGGGARSPIIQNAIRAATVSLAGEQLVDEKLVIPRDEMIEELVVLGGTVQ